MPKMDTSDDRNHMPKKLAKRMDELLYEEWKFLDEPWPMYPKTKKFHRSELKPILRVDEMKRLLLQRLGYIAVFFFLTTIWTKYYFPGPYMAVEKGIAFLYYFVSGETMDSMSQFLPRTSFYAIYTAFLKDQRKVFEKEILRCFTTMFSTPEIRIRSANWQNPVLFKHITLMLDGHDSRATYGEHKEKMYSYKLKKAGLRTQVAIDINGMVLFTSKSASCKDNNDGTMLVEMGIVDRIHEMDCIAVDGGYTQYIGALLEKEDRLSARNFAFPIRKKRLQPLQQEEATFNSAFGGFRSMVENTFGDLMRTFSKHNNREPVRINSKKEFNLSLRLCLLLMNVRNFALAHGIETLPHHRAWMEPGFDYPMEKKLIPELTETYTVQHKLESGVELLKLQEAFLGVELSDEDENMDERQQLVAVVLPIAK
jgi:hypothetical protein